MYFNSIAPHAIRDLATGLIVFGWLQLVPGAATAGAVSARDRSTMTRTPIKHVIVIIGENRSFDHVFATYEPKKGEAVWNLLAEGIIDKDGSPGPNFNEAEQQSAGDPAADSFLLSPPKSSFPGGHMPAPQAGGPKDSYITGNSLTLAQQSENGLPADYYRFLLSGGTGQAPHVPDARIANVNALAPGPFQLTNPATFDYDAYSASPVHRFYQMWQQLDCSREHAAKERPSGCDSHLFSWVEVTVGASKNGQRQPSNFSTDYSPAAATTGEGSTALGFYNMRNGDVPYFKQLADDYAMSDNFHQSVNGGTGANHIMLGHGDAIWFSDGDGHPLPPPHKTEVGRGTANAGVVDEVENPDPEPGTNNWYTQDGYGGGSTGSPSFGGGS